MILFTSDYTEGAHPEIIKKLIETNLEQTQGYGVDIYSNKAKEYIKEHCGRKDMDVHFLVGGTQTNITVISAVLRPHQGVIAAISGHINVHETGAIESIGHKVLAIPSKDGKVSAKNVLDIVACHYNDNDREHMVQPQMVYISNPTEMGTIYYKKELYDLHEACRRNNLFLYMDGARLGYGLTAEGNDLTLKDITDMCDIFYIGGTKVGALFGEAVVIVNRALKKDFRYFIKQKGGMLAKGRLLGLQFMTLFENDLYFTISVHANKLAMQLKETFLRKGYNFLCDSPTNQQFPILPDMVLDKLKVKYGFSYIMRIDENNSAVRFCTSWATDEKYVQDLISDLEQIV